MTIDRLIPSVEDAAHLYRAAVKTRSLLKHGSGCRECWQFDQMTEAAALALDMALAQASDRRRAADDELRRSVAW